VVDPTMHCQSEGCFVSGFSKGEKEPVICCVALGLQSEEWPLYLDDAVDRLGIDLCLVRCFPADGVSSVFSASLQ